MGPHPAPNLLPIDDDGPGACASTDQVDVYDPPDGDERT
jgi:hypothetical protein